MESDSFHVKSFQVKYIYFFEILEFSRKELQESDCIVLDNLIRSHLDIPATTENKHLEIEELEWLRSSISKHEIHSIEISFVSIGYEGLFKRRVDIPQHLNPEYDIKGFRYDLLLWQACFHYLSNYAENKWLEKMFPNGPYRTFQTETSEIIKIYE
jgi:hypothetical protein